MFVLKHLQLTSMSDIAHIFLTSSGSLDFNTIFGLFGLMIALALSFGILAHALRQPTYKPDKE